MVYEREVLGTLLKYDSTTGQMWRWIECQAWDGLKHPRWLETGLSTNSKGARSTWLKGKGYLIHRVAFFVVTGHWPVYTVDHINRDRGDNRWANLRDVTMAENNKNKGLMKSNTSGVKGIHLSDGMWRARIAHNGKRINLGRFSSIIEATLARSKAERALGHYPMEGIII